ncbi:histidine phosphatase superfamily [Xylariaceae sp. FL1019]|nr:histidine phosphatase superfamily [Xylariaceae sp. FL1019]
MSTGTSSAEDSEWLQGSSGCARRAIVSSNNYLVSSEYATVYDQSQSFFTSLSPVINSTYASNQTNFKNAYSIFDYINVATIHNESDTIPSGDLLTPETINELQVLANIHEWNLAYNSSDTVRAIAGATLAAEIVEGLNATLVGKGAKPVNVQFGAYATFSSFFGLAQLQSVSADFEGIVDYAANMVFELVTNATVRSGDGYPSSDDVSVRFRFSNRSSGLTEPMVYPLFGQSETLLPFSDFAARMNKFAIGDTASWCQACGNTTGVCATSANDPGDGESTASSKTSNHISNAVAGVIGALVTLVVILGVEALIALVAGLRIVKRSTLTRGGNNDTSTTGIKA